MLGKRLRFDGEPFKIFQALAKDVTCLESFATAAAAIAFRSDKT
jgi:hypothetical protein